MVKCDCCGGEFKSTKSRGNHYRIRKDCLEYKKKQEEYEDSMKPKVNCMVCGKSLRNISNTHLKSHGITNAQYKDFFPSSPIFAPGLLEIQRENRTKTLNELYPNNEYGNTWFKKVEKYGSHEEAAKVVSDSCKKYWSIPESKIKQSVNIKKFYQNLILDKHAHKAHKAKRLEKRKSTNLEKYGVEFIQQLPETKEKAKNTLIKNYGSLAEAYAQRQRRVIKTRIENCTPFIYPSCGKKSQEMFRILDRILKSQKLTIYYGTKNTFGEFRVQIARTRTECDGVLFRFLDFYIEELKIAIEFDEDYHKKITGHDMIRESQIKNVIPDIKFLRVTEEEFTENRKETIVKCLQFIKKEI